jgi:Putative peptidoglycan binding domain
VVVVGRAARGRAEERPVIGTPNENYRRAFKEGMRGWDVQAVQMALNSHQGTILTTDGVFGEQTRKVVEREQANHHLEADGIIGVQTMSAICLAESRQAERAERLPHDLLRGLIEGESAYQFAAVGRRNSNGSRDAGVLQYNIAVENLANHARWEHAFSVRARCEQTAATLREKKDEFYGRKGAPTHKRAWELAVMHHNWQTAAVNMSNGYGPYREAARNTREEAWIVAASGGDLRTPNEWVADYIESKTLYVKRWVS